MKTTVIYHSADFDGIFCREIARKFLPEAELIGWNFGDPPLVRPSEGVIYILDLPVDRVFGMKFFGMKFGSEGHLPWLERVIWIDHHKSSIETHNPTIPGYRIDGVAACRLAWQWFTHSANPTPRRDPDGNPLLPLKEEFIDRKLSEPLAVRLAGEYDIWDKRDARAEVFQFGLRSRPLSDMDWATLLSEGDGVSEFNESMLVEDLLRSGLMLQRYQQEMDAGIVNHRSFLVEFEGLKFLALNTARCNSLTFAAKDVPETGHDALLGFYYNGKWSVSLYHARHRTDLDLSQVAVKYGGGGHRGACGFVAESLPFISHRDTEKTVSETSVANSSLDFDRLRAVNVARCEEVFHPIKDWSPTDWACAMAGETGEACNVVKKIRRLSDGTNQAKDLQSLEEGLAELKGELADTVIYADLLAARLGIGLGQAVREKFNEVSRQRGATHFL